MTLPLSARRHPDPRVTAACKVLLSGCPASDVLEVALTPRLVAVPGQAPPPVVRGPQAGLSRETMVLSPEEERRVEQAFKQHDVHGAGEVDIFTFSALCKTLELPVDRGVASEWLSEQGEVAGLSLPELKRIYGQMLAAQTPAVRRAVVGGNVTLKELAGTEQSMRQAFVKFAPQGSLSTDGMRDLLHSLGFPDVHGDKFDRFVDEWMVLEGKSGCEAFSFHDFVSCVNLLVDFAENQ